MSLREHAAIFAQCHPIIARMVRAEKLELGSDAVDGEGATIAVDAVFEAAIRLGKADLDAERQRLEKQLDEARKRLIGLEKQLQNENFVTRAKPEAVEKTRSEAEKTRATITAAEERLAALV